MQYQWGGPPLKSRDVVTWRVHLWDENGVQGEWAVGSFEIGLLDRKDWRAQWITGGYVPRTRRNLLRAYTGGKAKRYPVDCFKKIFAIGDIAKARLYITACGLYEARINGERVEDFVMLGINRSLPATCFPAAVTSGASWDPSLMERIGEAIGAEARACGADLVLGPAANIKRSPLCGRSFEYFSEDPVVSGKMAAGFIRGLQKNGTGACLKHFACNNQEGSRFVSDSILDERTLREIYLTGFEIAVKEGKPAAVMCSYNKINGVHASDSRRLLTDVLRDEWGFDGLVVTDWGAMILAKSVSYAALWSKTGTISLFASV